MCHCILWNCISFGIAYTDDLNHHLQLSNRCRELCRRCLGKFTELCGWYGVTCTQGNCSSDTLGARSRICWTSRHCIQHIENSMYAGPTKAITESVLNKSQARKLVTRLCREVRYLGHVMTAGCSDDKYIKKQFRRQNAVANMLVIGSYDLHVFRQKSNCSSHINCCPIYGCPLWCHLYQNSIRKLIVGYNNTLKRITNVPRYTSSGLAFTMNSTDHINVLFRKFTYSLWAE